MRLDIHRLDPGLPMPTRAHDGDAGLDLYARESAVLPPNGGRAGIPTGIALAIDPGQVGLILPRSGLALENGVTVLNAPGVVDSGFRGELLVILVNHDQRTSYEVARGDRIAQLVVIPVAQIEASEAAMLPDSKRGGRGLGKSGR